MDHLSVMSPITPLLYVIIYRNSITAIIWLLSYHAIFFLFCAAAPLTNNRNALWSRDAQFEYLWCSQSFDVRKIIIYSIKIIIVYVTHATPSPFLYIPISYVYYRTFFQPYVNILMCLKLKYTLYDVTAVRFTEVY